MTGVLIIGGGLAGLAAATALAPRGFQVTILEARPRLGGRASSFTDAATGQLIDNCQHVSMGCCTNFAHFCRTVGINKFMAPQPRLRFMTADGRVSSWSSDSWPAPFHLARSFLAAHYLRWREKWRISRALLALLRSDPEADPPFSEWLKKHGQTPAIVERFWGLILTSALNETPDRIGLRYARKVIVEGFLQHPQGSVIEVPTVPLARFYGSELAEWLDRHGVQVRLNQGVRDLEISGDRVRALALRSGERLASDWFISAVPHDRLLAFLPERVIERHAEFGALRNLSHSPITSVHLWFDRPATRWPHVVLVGCLGQWVFNRGESAPGEHYLQVVISASHQLADVPHEEVKRRIVQEVLGLFPSLRAARQLRGRVVTERMATFSAVPGVDRWRPSQLSPITNLLLAGDWTATGWPATMEGAVRSGYLAAEGLLGQMGRTVSLVRPDLK